MGLISNNFLFMVYRVFILFLFLSPLFGYLFDTYFLKNRVLKNTLSSGNKLALVCAHNEEKVISNIIKDCFLSGFNKVFVILDSCTDKTKSICNSLGVDFVEVNVRSKSRALNYGIKYLKGYYGLRGFNRYDVYFFDADNRIDKDFLKFASRYVGFYGVVQFRVRNLSYNSSISKMYSIMFGYLFRLQSFLRSVSVSNLVCGTGFAMRSDIFNKYVFDFKTNTDLEYSIKLNHRIIYINYPVVFDEKPNSFIISFKQRVRWVRGHLDLFFSNWGGYQKGKLFILVFPVLDVLMLFLFFYNIFYLRLNFVFAFAVSYFINLGYYFVLCFDDDLKHLKFYDFLLFGFFSLSHYLVIIVALLTMKNRKKWFRTPHKGGVIC